MELVTVAHAISKKYRGSCTIRCSSNSSKSLVETLTSSNTDLTATSKRARINKIITQTHRASISSTSWNTFTCTELDRSASGTKLKGLNNVK